MQLTSDADGYVASDTDHLAVFTYEEGVNIDMAGFGNDGDNFNIDDLDGMWTVGTLSLTDDDVNNIIYLTGLSGGSRLMGDANRDGFVDDNDLSLLLANWGKDVGWGQGEFSGTAPVDDNDLSLLLANWTGSAPAGIAVPEPASAALLVLGALVALRRRRN